MRMLDVTCPMCQTMIGTLAICDSASITVRCKCGAVIAVNDSNTAEPATLSIGQVSIDFIVNDKSTSNATKATRLRGVARRWTEMAERTNAYLGHMAKRALDASLPFEALAQAEAAHLAEVKARQVKPTTTDKDEAFRNLCIAMNYMNPGCLDNISIASNTYIKFDPKMLVGNGKDLVNVAYRNECKKRIDALRNQK